MGHYDEQRDKNDAKKTQPSGTVGVKYDEGKADKVSLYLQLSCALSKTAEVLEHGTAKYGYGNFKHVEYERYIKSLYRHLDALSIHAGSYDNIKDIKMLDLLDSGTGLPEIYHVIANLLIIAQKELEAKFNDRTTKLPCI